MWLFLTLQGAGTHFSLILPLPNSRQHFPFRVNAQGTIRLGLNYRLGSNEYSYEDRKGVRITRSREFRILETRLSTTYRVVYKYLGQRAAIALEGVVAADRLRLAVHGTGFSGERFDRWRSQ